PAVGQERVVDEGAVVVGVDPDDRDGELAADHGEALGDQRLLPGQEGDRLAFRRAWSIRRFSWSASPPRSPASNPGLSAAISGLDSHVQGMAICCFTISTAQRRLRTLDCQCGPWASISCRTCVSRALMIAVFKSAHSRSLISGRAGGSKGLSGSWI